MENFQETLIFLRTHWLFFAVIGLMIVVEMISRYIKRKMKKSIFAQYDGSTDPKHGEYYLEYYRKSQFIDMIRIMSVKVPIVTGKQIGRAHV